MEDRALEVIRYGWISLDCANIHYCWSQEEIEAIGMTMGGYTFEKSMTVKIINGKVYTPSVGEFVNTPLVTYSNPLEDREGDSS